ncbi:uncharacterized protein LOC117109014 isoform X2 [Anneissia japonica]|uniref:uncharacterized protein LOC117109014 isoform X2 n=1 Tax=Anneissia japonica TaxID=1529436 RepID=UPI0014255DAC|nr:uncharacterized protein LOC117109014 isoform X2 [Anneissia japonica]
MPAHPQKKGKKHEKCAKEIAQNQTFKFTSQSGPLKEKLIRAEVLFTAFILEHNLPFAVSQHANQLFKQMFPDSEVAKEYRCSYMKTAAITGNALEPEASKVMFSCLRDRRQPFTLMLDESNDILCQKECAILVPVCNVATAQKIFDVVNGSLCSSGLLWDNVVGFSSDNCNMMIGKRASVLTKVTEKAPNIYSVGCPSHLVNI